MPNVAPVRLTYNPHVLWFDPNGVEFVRGDALIVRTERGLEYGTADSNLKEVTEEDLQNLKCELKPVLRKATAEDKLTWQNLQTKSQEALPVFKRMVEEQGLEMHPVAVEYLFDGDKAVFYFEADDRVDFRDLVRQLAGKFRVRIDMRQIGVRDEARIVGGYGHCGQELCCARMGGEFNPVTIRMAKSQDLSLNPQKISGLCGRLMCCLRYEADAYKECKSRCPKVNSMIHTPAGDTKVLELNVPRETVTIMVGEKRVRIPVAEMEIDPKTGKPGIVPDEAYEAALNEDTSANQIAELFSTQHLTGTDRLASPFGSASSRDAAADAGSRRSGRKSDRSAAGSGSGDASQASGGSAGGSTSGRKRRNRSRTAEGAASGNGEKRSAQEKSQSRSQNQGQGRAQGRGQSQDALRDQVQAPAPKRELRRRRQISGKAAADAEASSAELAARGQSQDQGQTQTPSQGQSRGQSRGQSQGKSQGQGQNQGRGKSQSRGKSQNQDNRQNQGKGQGQGNRQSQGKDAAGNGSNRSEKPRPGRKSSGLSDLSGAQSGSAGAGQDASTRQGSKPDQLSQNQASQNRGGQSGQGQGSNRNRKPRRRTQKPQGAADGQRDGNGQAQAGSQSQAGGQSQASGQRPEDGHK